MKFLYSLGGGNIPVIREYDIEANKQFKKGQVVKISLEGVISTTAAGGCIGIAAEDHTAEKDILNERNNGTKLRVDITRHAVYEVDAPRLVATGGSNTTFVCSSTGLMENLENSTLVLVRKGENSENTDTVGTVRKVSLISVSNTSATFTISDGGIVSEGDVYALIPICGFMGNVGGNDGSFKCVSTMDSTPAFVMAYNTDTLTLEVMPKKDFIAY
ncbi:MAG: hypothetical protein E7600_01175 [Ruminococcaceae bacterium]|nr:hypothetical protein [Oscillospiraceae bacterium]